MMLLMVTIVMMLMIMMVYGVDDDNDDDDNEDDDDDDAGVVISLVRVNAHMSMFSDTAASVSMNAAIVTLLLSFLSIEYHHNTSNVAIASTHVIALSPLSWLQQSQ